MKSYQYYIQFLVGSPNVARLTWPHGPYRGAMQAIREGHAVLKAHGPKNAHDAGVRGFLVVKAVDHRSVDEGEVVYEV